MKLLFVDDEHWAYGSIIEEVRRKRHEIVVCGRDATQVLHTLGAQGLRSGEEYGPQPEPPPPYDLIVLDIMMPVGLEGDPGGLLDIWEFQNAGVGLYTLIRTRDLGWGSWVSNVKVLVFTADNLDETYDQLCSVPNTKEGVNFEIVYKPDDRIAKRICSFLGED